MAATASGANVEDFRDRARNEAVECTTAPVPRIEYVAQHTVAEQAEIIALVDEKRLRPVSE